MKTETTILLVIGFILIFLIFVQSFLSSGLSQTTDQINTINDDIEEANLQNTINTENISSLNTKTQNMTSTLENTSFEGTLEVTNTLIVNGVDVNQQITNINNVITTGQYNVDTLVVDDLTTDVLSAQEFFITSLVPKQGILLTPCGYYMDTENGTPSTNKDFKIIYSGPIMCTVGLMTQWNDVHGYIINPGFAIRAFRSANYVTIAGEFINNWSSPAVFLTNGTTFQAGPINSVIVYYGGVLFNPLAYGQNPTINNAIPSQYVLPPTSSTVPPEGIPFYS